MGGGGVGWLDGKVRRQKGKRGVQGGKELNIGRGVVVSFYGEGAWLVLLVNIKHKRKIVRRLGVTKGQTMKTHGKE